MYPETPPPCKHRDTSPCWRSEGCTLRRKPAAGITMQCQCKVIKRKAWMQGLSGGKWKRWNEIEFCPLHSAAEELRTQLMRIYVLSGISTHDKDVEDLISRTQGKGE